MGQEIIARMKYRGKFKKKLFSISLDFNLPRRDYLYNVKKEIIAKVVNQVFVDGKTYFLAVFNYAISDTSIVLADNLKAKVIN